MILLFFSILVLSSPHAVSNEMFSLPLVHLSSLELHHSLSTLLVEHAPSAVRAGNQRILAKGDVAAAVAADVGHDGTAVVSLSAGCTTGHGSG